MNDGSRWCGILLLRSPANSCLCHTSDALFDEWCGSNEERDHWRGRLGGGSGAFEVALFTSKLIRNLTRHRGE